MKKIYSVATAILISLAGFSQIPTDALVARYDFSATATALQDAGVNNYSLCGTYGYMTAGVAAGDSAVYLGGNALYYCDGTAGGASQFLSPNGAGVSVWFKTAQGTGYGLMATLRRPIAPFNAFTLGIYNGRLFGIVDDMGITVGGDSLVNDGQWHHAVLTYVYDNGTGAQILYLDGEPVDVNTVGAPVSLQNDVFSIGSYNGGDPFTGSISQVLYYNRFLDTTDVTGIMADMSPSTVSIQEAEAENTVSVYPNPTGAVLTIETAENTNIHIISLPGATVASQRVYAGNNTVDVSHLTKGIYFIQMENGRTVKFVKE